MLDELLKLYLSPDKAGESGGATGSDGEGDDPKGGDPEGSGGTPESFDAWIKEQPKEVQELHSQHVSGLKSALQSERETRKEQEKELRKLADEAEEGSAAKQRLTKMADEQERLNRRADFYEEAHSAGVTNLKLAYLVAEEEKLFDRRGNVNFEAMEENFPELFGGGQKQKVPKGTGGEGTGGEGPTGKKSMNTFIRKSAGR